ncbi:MAG: polysaccharide deacetylase family protein [Gemmatimonadaceae bacterium]
MSLEAQYSFRSTWFFLPEDVLAPHRYDMDYRYDDVVTYGGARTTVAGMMQAIAGAGWEVALHGSYRSASDADMLRNEREQVERVIARPVVSVRQHFLQYDVLRTPGVQSRAGLRCDSTHGFNEASGFRAEAAFPYWCWDSESNAAVAVLELPLHVMDSALFGKARLGYDESTAEAHVLSMLDAVAEVGGCLMVNWHPNYIEIPRYWRTYATLLKHAAAQGAWGCSCEQLYDAWTQWEARLGLPSILEAPSR